MKYYIDGQEVNKYEFEEGLREEIKDCCEEEFDEMLDETHGEIEVVGIKYDASTVLEKVDPIAYHMEFLNYVDYIYSDRYYELECNEEITLNGVTFEMIE